MNKTPKQIDNAIQRIKNKLKTVLKSMLIAWIKFKVPVIRKILVLMRKFPFYGEK